MPPIDVNPRYDWTTGEIEALLKLPLLELVSQAHDVSRANTDSRGVQLASLMNIKTGGCAEDCSYCSQSAHHEALDVSRTPLSRVGEVEAAAKQAKELGTVRFCMGAAWREVTDGPDFEAVLEMVRAVRALDMEPCVTLGMLKPHQAKALKAAGLQSYNHNIDTSPEYYGQIITTRTLEDRLETLSIVRAEGIDLCTGVIIGLGESLTDRASALGVLACMSPHPESVPINALVAIEGTPLEDQESLPALDFVRMIATARIVMPRSRIRLAAGRQRLSPEAQALCFLAGANSIFYGERLLTTPNAEPDQDQRLLAELGVGLPA
ncbi:MAG: biotin synthase BioB [Alphaproteobacteria bacterium]|jgi:biotin synthase|nr:biotin synthase BioB [Alphaproteobacteria bacterium]